jgi:hypothetical protein
MYIHRRQVHLAFSSIIKIFLKGIVCSGAVNLKTMFSLFLLLICIVRLQNCCSGVLTGCPDE